VYYTLASNEVYWTWKSLRDLTHSLSPYLQDAINQIQKQNHYHEPVNIDQVKEREDVYLLDVRPKDEYEKGHIPHAHSVPLDELNERLNEIPKDKLVIAYCRGVFCLMADEAVEMLRRKGYNAKKIKESVWDCERLQQP